MSTEICNSVRFNAQEMRVIGERICNIRQIVDNCTQAEFAAKYGVSVRVISDIESGNHAPSAELLYQLRKNNHDLNSILAPIHAEKGGGAVKVVLPTETEFHTKLLSNLFKVPLTAEDMEVFADYCVASPIKKMFVQAALASNEGDKMK